MRDLHAALDGYLRTDEASRALWSTDASIYLRKPVGVARSEADVGMALGAAHDLGLSTTPAARARPWPGRPPPQGSPSTSPRCRGSPRKSTWKAGAASWSRGRCKEENQGQPSVLLLRGPRDDAKLERTADFLGDPEC